jgi:hypothetical protein
MSVSRILRVKPSSDSRELPPETLAQREARKTPRNQAADPAPDVAPVRVPTTLVVTDRGKAKQWRWAWLALLLVMFAGLAAVVSRRYGAQAATAGVADAPLPFARDAGSASAFSTGRAAQRPPGLPTPVAMPTASPPPSEPVQLAAEPTPVTPVTAPPQSEPLRHPDSLLPSGRSTPRSKTRVEKSDAPTRSDISNFGGRR